MTTQMMLKVPTQTLKQSLRTIPNNPGTTAKSLHQNYPKIHFLPADRGLAPKTHRKPDADRGLQDVVDRSLLHDLSPKSKQTVVSKNSRPRCTRSEHPKWSLSIPIFHKSSINNKTCIIKHLYTQSAAKPPRKTNQLLPRTTKSQDQNPNPYLYKNPKINN